LLSAVIFPDKADADMAVPETLRVDTGGGIKPAMAFLAPADGSRGNA
jgi:hypothetical protein